MHSDLYLNTLVLTFSPKRHPSHLSTRDQISSRLPLLGCMVGLCYDISQNQASEPALQSVGFSPEDSIESSGCQMLNQSAVCPKLRHPHSLLFLPGMTFYAYSASPPNYITPSTPLREGCGQMSKTAKSVKGSCDFQLFQKVGQWQLCHVVYYSYCVYKIWECISSRSVKYNISTYCVQQIRRVIISFTSHDLYNIPLQ